MKLAVFIGADPQVAEVARLGICLRWPAATLMVASDATQGLDLVRKETPDLVLVRPDLSDKSLADVIRELRSFSHVPLIVLSRPGNDLEGYTALEAGADEYVQLPGDLSELTFKIWSLMRRTGMDDPGEVQGILVSGDLRINPATHQMFLEDREVMLTPVEFQLIYLLAKNCGNVMSHPVIERELSKGEQIKVGSIKQHVMQLRRKMGDKAREPRWIASVPGLGYRFMGPRNGGPGV